MQDENIMIADNIRKNTQNNIMKMIIPVKLELIAPHTIETRKMKMKMKETNT